MRKSVAWSAVFLAAIVLGLCGRLPLVRAGEPPAGQGAAGQGQDPFAPLPQAPSSAEKPPAASPAGKPADGGDPWVNYLSAPGKAASAQPQCVEAKPAPKAARKARPQTFAASPEPSGQASMKVTVGKVPSRSAAAELAAEEEIIEKALLRPVTLELVEMPLNRVVEELARQLDVNVMMDHRALNNVGIDPATPVTCKVTNLPLRFALVELLRPLELTWEIRGGTLLVTTPEEAETHLTTRVYDVSSLLVSPPDYPASRSGDLGDPDSLFGPPTDRNEFGGINGLPSGYPIGYGFGGMGGVGISGGMMNVSGQPGSPPILRQNAAPRASNRARSNNTRVNSPLDFDSIIDSITSTIQPTVWDDVGGPCSISPFPPQQLLVVSASGDVHDQVAAYLDTLRHHAESRPQVRIEAHWLWLTEPELASLLVDQDKASHSAGDVVAEAAWKKLRQQKRDAGDDAAGAFEAILKGQNGQLISGVSGRQTRVMITLIPVVGAPPAAGGGGMGSMGIGGGMPGPSAQTPVLPTLVRTYAYQPSQVGYQPVCRTIQEGSALEVRPFVVAEGKEILLDLRSRFVQREDSPDAKPQTPAAGAAAGANRAAASPSANVVQAIAAAVDRPQIHHYRLETTLRVPAGRRVLAGGLTYGEPSADESNLYLFVEATVVAGPAQAGH